MHGYSVVNEIGRVFDGCGTSSANSGYSPTQIPDQLEEWFLNNAAEGFNIMPPYLPGGLEEFVNLVILELQRRGLFRTQYEGHTLREHLGLPRLENQFIRKTIPKSLALR